jgi:hypothetical protein
MSPPQNQKETINMSYNEYGEVITTQEAMDEAFTLLAVDLEIDEDTLREEDEFVEAVKQYALDAGPTWEDLVELCDKLFGTVEERLDNPTHEN